MTNEANDNAAHRQRMHHSYEARQHSAQSAMAQANTEAADEASDQTVGA